ncbi:unnamed protein product [Protopolystoma xenopodis]|uniref:Uncharacterized protein n=1 Tax=Protopolystoma xenopodis TaxID=117903 RepID=A0A448XCB9_9PLAT|nr:unnamed protein product [Protopolystoma xenopodis]
MHSTIIALLLLGRPSSLGFEPHYPQAASLVSHDDQGRPIPCPNASSCALKQSIFARLAADSATRTRAAVDTVPVFSAEHALFGQIAVSRPGGPEMPEADVFGRRMNPFNTPEGSGI